MKTTKTIHVAKKAGIVILVGTNLVAVGAGVGFWQGYKYAQGQNVQVQNAAEKMIKSVPVTQAVAGPVQGK